MITIGDMEKSFFKQYQRRGYNCIAILTNEATGEKRVIPGHNIVTNKGNLWYTQRAVLSASAFLPAGIKLGIGSTAVAATDTDVQTSFTSCYKALTAGYPTLSDADTDNTGKGSNVATWEATFATTDVSQVGIRELVVCDASAVTGILNHALFAAAFDKTYSDTLKIFVNHTFTGI